MAIYHPPSFVNAYLQEKLALGQDLAVPMFPTMPTDLAAEATGFSISDLTTGGNERFYFNGAAAIYDRMFRMRRLPFPHVKCEQLVYYFYSLTTEAVPKLIEITQHIQDLLDNGDESAEDLNEWVRIKQASNNPLVDENGNKMPLPYFHSVKVYQLQETRDIIDFATARTYAGNKMILEYDWHKVPEANPAYNVPGEPGYNSELPYDPNKYLPIV